LPRRFKSLPVPCPSCYRNLVARLGRTYDRILEIYAQIDSGTPADTAFAHVLKKARDLGSSERAEVRDTIYSLLRKKRTIDDRLERASKAEKRSFADLDKPIQHRLRVMTLWALEGATLAELEERDAYALKRIPRAFERMVGDKLPKPKRSELEELAIEISLPTFLVARLVNAFGAERAELIGKALNTRAPVTLRANRLKTTRDALAERLRQEHGLEVKLGKLSPDAVILPPHGIDLMSWNLFREGWCELQDEGSQLIALAVGAKPGERVLDACAGAGGKTLALAAAMENRGKLVAFDTEKKKLKELEKRAERAGAIVETRETDVLELHPEDRGQYDAVLVDAPCTGTGTLRRHPDTVWRLTEQDIDRESERQRQLLTAARWALKPGGRLIYATCSVLFEENEAIAKNIHSQAPVNPLPLAQEWGDALSEKLAATHEARIGPGPTDSDPDGFYVVAFRV
jgi:16S rRNA (cytosine967-C5)-methyltransferase